MFIVSIYLKNTISQTVNFSNFLTLNLFSHTAQKKRKMHFVETNEGGGQSRLLSFTSISHTFFILALRRLFHIRCLKAPYYLTHFYSGAIRRFP